MQKHRARFFFYYASAIGGTKKSFHHQAADFPVPQQRRTHQPRGAACSPHGDSPLAPQWSLRGAPDHRRRFERCRRYSGQRSVIISRAQPLAARIGSRLARRRHSVGNSSVSEQEQPCRRAVTRKTGAQGSSRLWSGMGSPSHSGRDPSNRRSAAARPPSPMVLFAYSRACAAPSVISCCFQFSRLQRKSRRCFPNTSRGY